MSRIPTRHTPVTRELAAQTSKENIRAFLEVLSATATQQAIAAAVAALVNSSPATLDQLNELAAAIGNDPNFAVTLATALAGKQPLSNNLTTLAQAAAITSFCANLLSQTDGPDFRAAIGAGTSNFSGAWNDISAKPTTLGGFGITDALTAAQIAAAYQPLSNTLTLLAGQATQPFGRSLMGLVDQAALQAAHGISDEGQTDQPFTETITWTGVAAPSGAASNRFHWYRVGKFVHFRFKFEWTTLGSSLTSASWPFPSGFPTPAIMSNDSASEALTFGVGGAGATSSLGNTATANISSARINRTAGGTPEARIVFGSTNVGSLYMNGFYRCV